jgi:hypothetical protein
MYFFALRILQKNSLFKVRVWKSDYLSHIISYDQYRPTKKGSCWERKNLISYYFKKKFIVHLEFIRFYPLMVGIDHIDIWCLLCILSKFHCCNNSFLFPHVSLWLGPTIRKFHSTFRKNHVFIHTFLIRHRFHHVCSCSPMVDINYTRRLVNEVKSLVWNCKNTQSLREFKDFNLEIIWCLIFQNVNVCFVPYGWHWP